MLYLRLLASNAMHTAVYAHKYMFRLKYQHK